MRQAEAETRRLGNEAASSRESVTRLGRALDRLGRATTGINNSVAASNVQALRFQKTIDRTSRRVWQFRSRLFSLRGVIGTVFGAGVGVAIERSARFGAQLQNQSRLVGLSVEALQELRGAAEEYGIANRAADIGIQRFARRVGEAAQGAGVLSGVFEDYGIAARDANGAIRSTEAVLADFADVLAATESESERLLLAFKAFDTEGARFAEVLRGGSGELEAARERARLVGQITTEQAESLRQLSIAFDSFRTSVITNISRVVADNADSLRALLDRLATGLPRALQAVGAAARVVSENIHLIALGLAGILALRIGRLTLEFAQWARHLSAAAAATTGVSRISAVLGGLGLAGGVAGLGALALAFGAVAIAAKRATDRMREQQEQLRRTGEQAQQTAERIRGLSRAELDAAATQARITAQNLRNRITELEVQQTNVAGRQAARRGGAAAQQYREREEALERLREQLAFAIRDEQAYEEALRSLEAASAGITANTQTLAEQLASVRTQIEAVSTSPVDIALLRELRDANEELARRRQLQDELVNADRLATAQVRMLAEQLDAVNRQIDDLSGITAEEFRYARAIRDANEQLERQRRIREELINLDRQPRREIAALGATNIDAELDELRRRREQAARLGDRAGQDAATAEIRRLRELQGAIVTPITQIQGPARRSVEELQRLVDATALWREAANDAADSMVRGLADVLLGVTSLRDGVQRLIQDLVQLALRVTILEPLTQLLRQGIGAGTGGVSIPGFARGGITQGLSLVGERGPELIAPVTPTRVFSAEDTARLLGGGPTIQIINQIDSTDGPGVQAALDRTIPGLVQQVRDVVAVDAGRRGSPLNRAVRSATRS